MDTHDMFGFATTPKQQNTRTPEHQKTTTPER